MAAPKKSRGRTTPKKVKPRELTLNVNDLTFGELEEIETITGKGVNEMLLNGQPNATLLVAMVWMALRKDDPNLTLDDVRAMSFGELNGISDGGGAPNPTKAAGSKS